MGIVISRVLGFRKRVSVKGSIGILGFRGSYKWRYKSPNIGHNYSYPTHNLT